MALKDTVHKLKTLLHEVSRDLEKATDGNKAASQRVRTGTIKLERCAKCYRKESVAAEKKGGKKAKPKSGGKKGRMVAMHCAVKRPTAKLPSRRR